MILLGHGSGGRLSHDLVEKHFVPKLANPALESLLDSGVVGDLALTTDGYVVSPRFFPGGDLGRLAVSGTVNDLAVVGADPIGLTAGFILEEGLALEELDRIVDSLAETAREAGVQIVSGDTKVVPRGACDGIFITTAGVGRLRDDFRPEPSKVQVGDRVLINGTIADHGLAVLSVREGLRMEGELKSDVAPLNGLIGALRQAKLPVHAMRDPTRGGVCQSLIEIADGAGHRISIEEEALPLRKPVRSACELLGLDPLYVANEGKVLIFVPPEAETKTLEVLHEQPYGKDAAAIGTVVDGPAGCEVLTPLGAKRSLRMATGELLPRIC